MNQKNGKKAQMITSRNNVISLDNNSKPPKINLNKKYYVNTKSRNVHGDL